MRLWSGTAQKAASTTSGDGCISPPPDALKIAQAAAERVGEVLVAFIAHAIKTQSKRDKSSLKLGIILHAAEI